MGAGFFWAHNEAPSPAIWWAVGFLFVVVEEDMRTRRIPNWLTAPALVVSLLLCTWFGGWSGVGTSLLGAVTAFTVLFPAFLLRWMGAGDVKALMVLGALWGPLILLATLWWMLIAGGLLALVSAGAQGRLLKILRSWGDSLSMSLASRRPVYKGTDSVASGIPFGVAMGLGAIAYGFWGLPWV
jgi:prepilin peptidase CpaA